MELRWAGKDQRSAASPCALQHVPELSTHSGHAHNMLIHGDNLPALLALDEQMKERVKCIYIDPPYNTGGAFAHYDDNDGHAAWLSFMRDRLAVMQRLLRDDGVLFVHIDDHEAHYLKVLLDEIFGRQNFCGQIVWEKKKKPSFLNANLAIVTEYILAYSPKRSAAPPFVGGLTTEGKKFPLHNAGNGQQVLCFPARAVEFRCRDGQYDRGDMSTGNIRTRLLDDVEVLDGRNVGAFRMEGEWRYSQRTLDALVAGGERLVISKPPFRPNHVKAGRAEKKLKNLLTVHGERMATHEDAAAESEALFGAAAFDYPKPEKLLQILLEAVTKPGDLVLDAFLGSGTTAAVAHKLQRRWIGIERGEQALTHCAPRLRRVVEGRELGGITAAVAWTGGGDFGFYRVEPGSQEPR